MKLQDQVTLQQRADLNTATSTVYVIVFIAAIITYSMYTHHLQKQRARLRVKVSTFNLRIRIYLYYKMKYVYPHTIIICM